MSDAPTRVETVAHGLRRATTVPRGGGRPTFAGAVVAAWTASRMFGDGCFARTEATVFDLSGGDGGGVDASRRACLSGLGWLHLPIEVVLVVAVAVVEVDSLAFVAPAEDDGGC